MKAVILNLTDATQHLSTHAGESVSVMPSSNNGQGVQVDVKFLEWITPHPNVIRVLYYVNDQGERVDYTPPSHESPAEETVEQPHDEPAAETNNEAPHGDVTEVEAAPPA